MQLFLPKEGHVTANCKGQRVLDNKPIHLIGKPMGVSYYLQNYWDLELESEQNSSPRLARVNAPSYLSNTCHAPSNAKMKFSDSPVGIQIQKWFVGLLRVIEAGVLIFRRRESRLIRFNHPSFPLRVNEDKENLRSKVRRINVVLVWTAVST